MNNEELHEKFGVTTEELEARAAKYETESWSGMTFGKVVQGCPRISTEELKTVTVKVPASRVAAIGQAAKKEGISRSDFLRRAIDNELASIS